MSSGFSTDGSLISASTVPYCRELAASKLNNKFIFSMVSCKDSLQHLRKIPNPYKKQIAELQKKFFFNGVEWTKKVRVFMFGDYDFLPRMYWISSTRSYHPCVWCKASKHQTQRKKQVPHPNIWKRTMEKIERDHKKYLMAGNNKKKAKSFNNVTFYPVWDIKQAQVCLLYTSPSP